MSKTNGGFLKRTWGALHQLLGSDSRFAPRRKNSLAPLQELEDRRLLSGTPITLGHTSESKTPAATTLSWSHTVGNGSNRVLIVEVSIDGTDTVASVAYGSTPLTFVGASIRPSGPQVRSEIWELVAPPVGNANVVVSLTGTSTSFVAGAADFFGVDQANPTGAVASTNGTGGNPSVTIASSASDLVIGVGSAHALTSSSPGAGETALWMDMTGSSPADAWGAAATAPGASATTLSWTTSGSGAGEWSAAAVSLLPAAITLNTTSLTTSETGASASFTIALVNQPTAPVTINLSNGNSAEGYLSQTSVTFSTSNWNAAQTVTVTGLDDHIVHGDQTYQINGTASSSDANYNGLAMPTVTVVNTEADVAGFTVTPASLTTSEAGTAASFSVALTSQPIAPVTINLTNGDPAQGSLSQTSLTFDAANWNTAQTVTVTGLDDHTVNGNQTYQIMGTASSTDAVYNGMAMTPVTVTNTEADVAGFTVSPTSIQTSMSGASASFSVVMTSAPSSPVTINLSSTNPSEGTLSTNTLTFDAGNWNIAQTVTVTGQNDLFAGGDVTYQINGSAGSSDANYNGLAMTPVTVTNVNTTQPGFVVTPTTLTTSETGTSATFSIALATLPLTPVTVNLTNGNPAQGTLSQSSLTFTLLNWNVPQAVTVTGLDDHIVNGNQTYQITGIASGLLSSYDGLAITPITVTNTEADVAGISVSTTTLTTSETGTSASFDVTLTSQPTAGVTINLGMSVAGQGTLSPSSLTFDATNWNVAQTVTVTGLDDHIVHGDQTYQITGAATGADSNYNTVMTPVTVTNAEADVAGFTVAPTSLTTSESGTSASFTVALTSQPISAVTVSLQPTDASQGSLSQSTLTFDAGNWNAPQTVTVTGLDSYMTTPSVTYQITGSATSADAVYNGLSTTPVTVTNAESPNASSSSIVASANPSTYGQSVTFTATVSGVAPMTGTPTGTVTFFDGSNNLATVSLTGGSAAFTTSAFAAGTHNITVTYGGDSYFSANTSSALAETIAPATLTVTANDASKVYGQANPAFTDTITGFVNGEDASVVSGNASLTTTATTASGVGSYAITAAQGSLSAANYTFAFTNGTLTVNPTTLTITANDASKTYGQSVAFAGTEFTTSGLVNSDTVASVTLASTGAAATATVSGSPYAITASAATGTGLGNYNINYVNGALAVTPATLTVTANNATKGYGQANPAFSDTITGFVNGENASVVNGSASLTTTATASSGVGFYPITAAQGSLSAANYTFAFANGTLIITPIAAPTPPTSIPPIALLPAISPSTPPASSSAGGMPSPSAPTSAPPAALLSPALLLAATAQGSRGNDAAMDLSLALLSSVNSATRTIHVFSPIPQVAWREVQMASALMTSETPLDMLVARVSNASSGPVQARLAQPDDGFDVLNAEGERVPWTEPGLETSMVAGAGVIAASGYVLLNSRLGLWWLGLLTSQPLWKQFDPLEVLYAWEEEDERVKDEQEEETLLSLVD